MPGSVGAVDERPADARSPATDRDVALSDSDPAASAPREVAASARRMWLAGKLLSSPLKRSPARIAKRGYWVHIRAPFQRVVYPRLLALHMQTKDVVIRKLPQLYPQQHLTARRTPHRRRHHLRHLQISGLFSPGLSAPRTNNPVGWMWPSSSIPVSLNQTAFLTAQL